MNFNKWLERFDDGELDELELLFLEVEFEEHGDRAETDSQNQQMLKMLKFRKEQLIKFKD